MCSHNAFELMDTEWEQKPMYPMKPGRRGMGMQTSARQTWVTP